MAVKKPKKEAGAAGADKESDEDFLKRLEKMRESSSKKVTEEISAYTKETEEFTETGKKLGKDLEEHEECKKIAEEFKRDPPIAVSKHINDISVEYYYEDRFKAKIELMKKHGFPFITATKGTYMRSPTFKTYGRAHVKRGGRQIPLPESSIPPLEGMGMGSRLVNPNDKIFVLEDGDRIETENDGYVVISDYRSTNSDETDKYKSEIFIFPDSQASLSLDRKETHPEPAFMDPSRVPEAIKRNSSNTVIEYNFDAISLVRGVFNVYILDEKKDTNKFLKMPSAYPDIEFLHSSKMIEAIQEKILAKMPAQIAAKYGALRSPGRAKICEEINAYIELCDGGSIVIFGTANSVKNRKSGKIASPAVPVQTPRDFIITGKMTVVGDQAYSDAPGAIDPRARAIIKNKLAVDRYASFLNTKRDFERTLKEMKEKKSKPAAPETEASRREKEKRKAELLEQQNYYKKAGDAEMADAVRMQLDELEPKMNANGPVVDEAYIMKMIAWCDWEIAKLKPDLDTNFPQYNAPG